MSIDADDFAGTCTYPGCTTSKLHKGTTVCGKHHNMIYKATSNHTLRHGGLTDEQITSIKKMKAALKTKHEIAKALGISSQTVGKVFNGTYKQRKVDE